MTTPRQFVDDLGVGNFELQPWFADQQATTSDDMYYKSASAKQIMFARDRLNALVQSGRPRDDYERARVISQHTSKSVVLPVYRFSRPDLGLELIARDNFYNWKLSVISDKPLDVDLSGLCHTTPPIDPAYTGDELSPVYFEGFPEALVFGYYETSDRMRWSAEFGSDFEVWTAVFLIMRAAGAVKPFQWSRGPRK